MTIHINQDALLIVLERPPANPLSNDDDDNGPLLHHDFWNPKHAPVEKLRPSTGAAETTTVVDDDSVTVSTASFCDSDSCYSGDSDESPRRVVSFAEDLVTDEWTRPFTPREQVAQLFYSTDDTLRFRQEYRMERKLLSELAVDPATLVDHELSALISSSVDTTTTTPRPRHSISRVVVVHNDKLETFSSSSCDKKEPDDLLQPNCEDAAFFDNDSFWSGSITWY